MTSSTWNGLGIRVPRKALGCWQLGGRSFSNGKPTGPGRLSQREALRIVHRCLDNDILLFDTAAGYCNGESEIRLGKAIQSSEMRDNAIICTKVSLTKNELTQKQIGLSFLAAVEASLKRLKTSCIDVLLIHNPPDNLDWQSLDTSILDQLVKSGKVKSYGVSATGIRGVKNVLDSKFGTTIEWVFNLVERRMEDGLLQELSSSGFNFIARSPLSRGLLSTDRLRTMSFDQDDWRSGLDPEWTRWVFSMMRKLELTKTECKDFSIQAILYILNQPLVSATALGINSESQLDEYLTLDSIPLDKQLIRRINQRIPHCYPPFD